MNKLNFLVSRFEGIDLPESIRENVLYSLTIQKSDDIDHINWKYLHTSEIYRNSKVRFSLYFNLIHNGQFNESLSKTLLKSASAFTQLIFHPNFEQTEGNPVIFVSFPSDTEIPATKFINDFEAFLILQGFKEIVWIQLSNTCMKIPVNELHTFREVEDFESFYFQLLKEKLYTANYIGIINESKKSVGDILQMKLLTEEKFETEFPHQSFVLRKYEELAIEKALLKERLEKAAEDLWNQKKYLHIMRSEDEAGKINNFYYHEYEVLPKWYKQFGHVLKVLTGKRSFRSLFDNNVKKYKD